MALVKFDPSRAFYVPGKRRATSSWTRRITGIDKSQKGGYSLLGDFMKRPRPGGDDYPLLEEGGLYLDCFQYVLAGGLIQREYRLFVPTHIDNVAKSVLLRLDTPGWAQSYWPFIERHLGKTFSEPPPSVTVGGGGQPPVIDRPDNPVSDGNPLLALFSTEDLIAEVRHRLALEALEEIPL